MFSNNRLSVLVLGSLLALSLLLVVGSFGSIWGDDPGPNVVNAKGTNIDIVDVTDHFPSVPDPVVFGTSKLLRTDEGIAFKLDTTGLVAGTGYTLWVFIDEDEESFPAPLAELMRYEIRMQMGGEFAASDGSGQFSSFFPAGALPDANGMTVLTTTDDGMFDSPMTADVLLIVRWHGKRAKGKEYQQTHFVNGGPKVNMSVQEAFHPAE